MPSNISKNMDSFDLYTEEVIRLHKSSYSSDESKFVLL